MAIFIKKSNKEMKKIDNKKDKVKQKNLEKMCRVSYKKRIYKKQISEIK